MVVDTVLGVDAASLSTEHVCRLLLAAGTNHQQHHHCTAHPPADAYAPNGPLRAACIDTLAAKLDDLFVLPPGHHERTMLEAFVLAVVPQEETGLGAGPTMSGLERLGSRLVRHASTGGALGPSLSLRPPSSGRAARLPPRAGTPGQAVERGDAPRGEHGIVHPSPFYESQPGGPGHARAPSMEDAIVPLAPSGMQMPAVSHTKRAAQSRTPRWDKRPPCCSRATRCS